MRVAVIHEWLVNYAGSERVVEQVLRCYPEADVFALVDFLREGHRDFIQNKPVRTSFLQKMPLSRNRFRDYLALMPLAVEQLDLTGYDLVISSSHAVAKGVLTGPNQLHISYVHSPMRYAWDLQHQYLKESGLDRTLKGWIAKWMLHKLRIWDSRSANGVDEFVANSHFIARRIEKAYRRKAAVIYPPVDINAFPLCEKKDDYYLTASRMVPYKRVELIVEAFSRMPDRHLVVIGDGSDFEKVKAKAGRNVSLLGYQKFDVMRTYMQRAKAFVFAAEEDFGITPVEAQACGTPVIAFGRGGVLESVQGRPSGAFSSGHGGLATGSVNADASDHTGVFFYEQSASAICEAVNVFERERERFTPLNCRNNALRFNPERFRAEFKAFVGLAWSVFQTHLYEDVKRTPRLEPYNVRLHG